MSTYDDASRHAQSIFRFFHVRNHKLSTGRRRDSINFPMLLDVKLANNQSTTKQIQPSPPSSPDTCDSSGGGGCAKASAASSCEMDSEPDELRIRGPHLRQMPVSAMVSSSSQPISPLAAPLPPPATIKPQQMSGEVHSPPRAPSVPMMKEPGTVDGVVGPTRAADPPSEPVAQLTEAQDDQEPAVAPSTLPTKEHQEAAGVVAPILEGIIAASVGSKAAPSSTASSPVPVVVPSSSSPQPLSVFTAWKEEQEADQTVPSSPPLESMWAEVEESFLSGESQGPLGLRCTLQTVHSLVQYYSGLKTRVDFSEEWKPGLDKGTKFETSLSHRVAALDLKGDRRDFLTKLLRYIFTSWEAASPPPPQPSAAGKKKKNNSGKSAGEKSHSSSVVVDS